MEELFYSEDIFARPENLCADNARLATIVLQKNYKTIRTLI